ncbi:MAG TPA: dockerin type I domain-containing protein [bacterium]|nr:dockerin type I domain-containing protein [bacterium]
MRTATSLLLVWSIILGLTLRGSEARAVDDLDRLYVINGLGETLTLIDRAGDSLVANWMPLGGCPNRVRAHDGLLLVVNSCTDDIMVIDAASRTLLRTVAFPSGDNPWDVLVLDDSLCAVSLLVANEVAIVNYQVGVERRRFAVGTSPEGLLYYAGRLWIANSGLDFGTFEYGQGTVSIANASLTAAQVSVNVGANPQVLAVGGDGEVHVLCTGNYADRVGRVYTLDRDSWLPTDSILINDYPGDLAIAPDGIGYIAGGGFVDSGVVYRYDSRTHAILNGPSNPWKTARGVLSVVPRLEGGVFALCFSADSVTELAANGPLVDAWAGGDGPGYAAYVTNRVPGDLNEDGVHNVQDVVEIINTAFRGGAPSGRPNAADVNGDCVCDILDAVALVNHVFRGGATLYWGCLQ